jgi:CubicO group peptidase (beta-lactamase class C family)
MWRSHYFREVLTLVETAIHDYCVKYTVPGLSLAVSREGRLVYARAFGYASVWPLVPLSVRHRMRIASVSKPITATAIMVLEQRSQLKLNDRIFGANALFGFSYAPPPYDANEVAIEVGHLLNHTSGFDDVPNDPADEQPAMNAHDLIGWTLNNRTPVAQPGTRFKYLNFGYVVLGRVIEQVSGQSYESFVNDAVLKPAGITSMTIGGDTAAARKPDEVTYYGVAGDQNPYAVRISRNDGPSGWIATPIDLLRFLRVVDGRGVDVLNAASRSRMRWPSPDPNYGLGWDISGTAETWTHNGALPGSVGVLRLRHNGDGLAALANTRQTGMQQNAMINDLTSLLEAVRIMLVPRPQFDLFE